MIGAIGGGHGPEGSFIGRKGRDLVVALKFNESFSRAIIHGIQFPRQVYNFFSYSLRIAKGTSFPAKVGLSLYSFAQSLHYRFVYFPHFPGCIGGNKHSVVL
jgi:hypothetical protein